MGINLAVAEGNQMERIVWLDSRSSDSWVTIDEIELRACKIISCGYIMDEDDETVCIAQSKCKLTSQYCNLMFIPKVCIVSRKKKK